MTNLIDTHCHIHSIGPTSEDQTANKWKELKLSPKQIISRAQSEGVSTFICIGTDLADSKAAVEFAQTNDDCYAAVGVHPHEARRFVNDQEAKAEFAALINQPKVVAIGECGLDYYYHHSNPQDQIAILKFQLDLALMHDLPLVFHVREAYSDFWPIINSYSKQPRGVLHSFTDSIDTLNIAIEKNLYIGVNGIATFARSEEQLNMYRAIPQANLLLETDSPYLTPAPYRGNINEPKYIVRIAEFLAELRDSKLDDLARATIGNTKQLFGI
ncbi:MAG: TatD family hydrolase [Candidatus Saccharimonadales bacterium]